MSNSAWPVALLAAALAQAADLPRFEDYPSSPEWHGPAGAVIDLQTGDVYPPPLAPEGNGWQHWIFLYRFI